MQKTQLLHLHSLFSRLSEHLEREGVIDGEFERYQSLNVRPSHAHKAKDRHREAVFALAADVADELAANSKYVDEESAGAVPADG